MTQPAETPTEFADRVSRYYDQARAEAFVRSQQGDAIDVRGVLYEWEQDAAADGDVVGGNTARAARRLFCETARELNPHRPLREQLGRDRVSDGLGR